MRSEKVTAMGVTTGPPEASPERGKEAGTEDLIEEDPIVVETTFREEWGRDYDERWAGVNAGILSAQRPLLSGRGVQDHIIAGKE